MKIVGKVKSHKNMSENRLAKKIDNLLEFFDDYQSVIVALSGGTDSSLLTAVAAASSSKALAVTVNSPLVPERDLRQAKEVAKKLGIRHKIVQGKEWELEEVRTNAPERCYYCKKERFTRIKEMASRLGYAVVVEGSQVNDLGENRPGMRAVRELGIRSPLLELGFTKEEVRRAVESWNLFHKPVPPRTCLATRFPYNTFLEEDELKRIDQAEEYLERKGVEMVRVRWEGISRVRIEVKVEDIGILTEDPFRSEMLEYFYRLGFKQVAVDLAGYRSGSMDERLGR